MSEYAFYPRLFPLRGAKSEKDSGAFLDRDRVEAMPVEPYMPAEINRELPPQNRVEVRLVKKESLAWTRRAFEVVDRDGNIHKIRVGYSHPDARDEAIICLTNWMSGKLDILYGRKFQTLGPIVAPFSRLTLQSVARDAQDLEIVGEESSVDIYPETEKGDPFARAGFFVVAKEAAIEERVRRLAERMDHRYPEGAQKAWDDYVDAQFDLAMFETIPTNRQRKISSRVHEQRCPAWMRFVSAREEPYRHEHEAPDAEVSLRVPFVDEEGIAGLEWFSWPQGVLARKQVGDTALEFIPHEKQQAHARAKETLRFREAQEAQRRRAYDARRNTISSDVRFLPETEQPFRPLVGGGLSNGKIGIPKERPHGVAAWNEHEAIRPLRAVDEQNWGRLLDVAERTYYRDLDRLEGLAREKRLRERQAARESVIRRKMIGECIDLKLLDDVTRVDMAFGERLLIEGIVAGKPTYIVDSPNHGVGLYVFHTLKDAQSWAAGKIDFIEARRRAKAFIAHDAGWEERVKNVLRDSEEGSAT